MVERHFVAYGVRIGFRADCRALLDTLEREPKGTIAEYARPSCWSNRAESSR